VIFNPQNLRVKNMNNIIIFILHSMAMVIFLPVLFKKMDGAIQEVFYLPQRLKITKSPQRL
jgi:hypothetical protein